MADPMTMFAIFSAGSSIVGGIAQKKASNKAAAAAQQAGEFNAQIIERDITLLENQRNIINNNLVTSDLRKRMAFRKLQGDVVAGYSYAGVDISQGTPMRVMRENARELEYELAVDQFNNNVTNMQISDAQEDARLSAQLSRMESGAQASAIRSQGTASLIQGFGQAARVGYQSGLFGG